MSDATTIGMSVAGMVMASELMNDAPSVSAVPPEFSASK